MYYKVWHTLRADFEFVLITIRPVIYLAGSHVSTGQRDSIYLSTLFTEETRKSLISNFEACMEAAPYRDEPRWESRKVNHKYSFDPKAPAVVENTGFVWCVASSKDRSDISYKFIFYFGVSVSVGIFSLIVYLIQIILQGSLRDASCRGYCVQWSRGFAMQVCSATTFAGDDLLIRTRSENESDRNWRSPRGYLILRLELSCRIFFAPLVTKTSWRHPGFLSEESRQNPRRLYPIPPCIPPKSLLVWTSSKMTRPHNVSIRFWGVGFSLSIIHFLTLVLF